jgi:hypothetical protein
MILDMLRKFGLENANPAKLLWQNMKKMSPTCSDSCPPALFSYPVWI